MANSNQQNGNGGGPWGQKPGGGGKGPWGSGPGGGNEEPPNVDVDEMMRNLQDKFGGVFGGGDKPGKGGGRLGGFGILVFLILGALLWVAMPGSGWYVAEADEEGVILQFGKYTRTEPPGFHFKLPVPFERVLKPKVTAAHQIDVGFSSSSSSRNTANASLMLTGDENIVELGFSVFWQIKEAQAYLFNVENPDNTLKAVAESSMREIVGKNNLQDIITERRGQIEEEARENIQAVMDGYGAGILVTQVQIARSQAPEGRVNDAFRDVVNAAQEKEGTINGAIAYRNDKVPKARGDAQRLLQEAAAYREATVAEAKGEAARFTLVYQEYKRAPQVTRQRMYLETMERVLEKSDKILLDPESAGGVVPYLPLNDLTRRGKGQ
ncbi:HflK protein [hydrothermal vent metagenome]|uniref:HflK protein n=1 Tax=hydrothermal vent metagenome TaxID=652676 RepID=A0A3B0RHM8_9ZZZZ